MEINGQGTTQMRDWYCSSEILKSESLSEFSVLSISSSVVSFSTIDASSCGAPKESQVDDLVTWILQVQWGVV